MTTERKTYHLLGILKIKEGGKLIEEKAQQKGLLNSDKSSTYYKLFTLTPEEYSTEEEVPGTLISALIHEATLTNSIPVAYGTNSKRCNDILEKLDADYLDKKETCNRDSLDKAIASATADLTLLTLSQEFSNLDIKIPINHITRSLIINKADVNAKELEENYKKMKKLSEEGVTGNEKENGNAKEKLEGITEKEIEETLEKDVEELTETIKDLAKDTPKDVLKKILLSDSKEAYNNLVNFHEKVVQDFVEVCGNNVPDFMTKGLNAVKEKVDTFCQKYKFIDSCINIVNAIVKKAVALVIGLAKFTIQFTEILATMLIRTIKSIVVIVASESKDAAMATGKSFNENIIKSVFHK